MLKVVVVVVVVALFGVMFCAGVGQLISRAGRLTHDVRQSSAGGRHVQLF